MLVYFLEVRGGGGLLLFLYSLLFLVLFALPLHHINHVMKSLFKKYLF